MHQYETMKRSSAGLLECVVKPQGSRAMHRPVVDQNGIARSKYRKFYSHPPILRNHRTADSRISPFIG